MTPDAYFQPLEGQSLLFPGQASRYRGQCVQSVLLWLRDTGTSPPIYPSAYQYYDNGIPGYTKVPVGAPILTGDIVVFGANFPPAILNGVGNGHIDVASASGTPQDYWAYDSNWSPLILTKTHHNGNDNKYIVGYLRKDSEMTSVDKAYGAVSGLYRGMTDIDPTPGQGDSWANQILAAKTIDEVLSIVINISAGLGANDYKGDPQFRYKGRHYDADMETKYEQGVADGKAQGTTPPNAVTLKKGLYSVE